MVTSLRSIATAADTDAYRGAPQFAVSLSKLAVMSLFTLGVYAAYWCYMQWSAIKRREEEVLSPVWRAVFAPLWGISLFPRIQELTARHGVPATWSGRGLGVAFFVLSVAWRLPDPWWLVSLLAFLPLLVVQRAINALNAAVAPGAERNERYSGLNVVVIVIGAIVLALAIWGTFSHGGVEQSTREVVA